MAFSEFELKKIEKLIGGLCQRRSPAHLRDELRLEYKIKGHDIVIYERRPRWDDRTIMAETPVAKIKLVRTVGEWRLYWQRRDLKWHSYPMLPSSHDLAELVAEIDEDPYACFFG